MMDLIRKVKEQDWTAIEDLVKQAFATASYSDGTEAALVARLRQGPAFLPDLALMAEREAKPAGFILFTKARVSQEAILALAPLAVKPCFQKSGIGTALVKKVIRLPQRRDLLMQPFWGILHFTVVWVMKRQKNGELRRQQLFLKNILWP